MSKLRSREALDQACRVPIITTNGTLAGAAGNAFYGTAQIKRCPGKAAASQQREPVRPEGGSDALPNRALFSGRMSLRSAVSPTNSPFYKLLQYYFSLQRRAVLIHCSLYFPPPFDTLTQLASPSAFTGEGRLVLWCHCVSAPKQGMRVHNQQPRPKFSLCRSVILKHAVNQRLIKYFN